jgi:hypothetical protein
MGLFGNDRALHALPREPAALVAVQLVRREGQRAVRHLGRVLQVQADMAAALREALVSMPITSAASPPKELAAVQAGLPNARLCAASWTGSTPSHCFCRLM